MALLNTYDIPIKIRKILTLSQSDWEEFSQTITVQEVGEDDVILVKPLSGNESLWISNRVYCSGQDDGELSFACSIYPKDDIRVEVVIIKGGISREQNIGKIILDKTSINVGIDNASETITATVVGDGELSVECDSDVVSISRNGNYVTVTPAQQDLSGSAKIYFYLSDTEAYCGAKAEVDVSVSWTNVYGVYWDGGSDPSMVRTDDAVGFADPVPAVSNGDGSSPFDELMPWAGMQRSTDANAGVVVSIPKFYYKWTSEGDSLKLQIADGPAEGFHTSPAHADRGDGKGERDIVYVGAYHCATSTYKSTSGVKPVTMATTNGGITYFNNVHNLGETIWQWDFAMYWTIAMLYLVEFASWNSQAKIGLGCGDSTSSMDNNGVCDSMIYHTGTNAASLGTRGNVRYRYIDGLWANANDVFCGLYGSGTTIYCVNNPSNFLSKTGGVAVGTSFSTTEYNNCIKNWTVPTTSGYEYALTPKSCSTGGTSSNTSTTFSKYICDSYWGNTTSFDVPNTGVHYKESYPVTGGLFMMGLDNDNSRQFISDTAARISTRLMILPNN